MCLINVLKFQTLVACQKGLYSKGRLRSDCLIRVFINCYSDMQYANSSPNQNFICVQKGNLVFEIL